MNAALTQLTQSPDNLFRWQMQVPDISKENVLKDPSWYKQFMIEENEKKSFENDWLNDWVKYVPKVVNLNDEKTATKVFYDLWNKQIKNSRDALLNQYGSYDAIANPFIGERGITYESDDTSTNRDAPNTTRRLGTIYDSSYRNAAINASRSKKGENPFFGGLSGNSPFEPKFKQENPSFYSVTLPGSPVMLNGASLKNNKILVPGKYNPNRPPKINVDYNDPFSGYSTKITSRGLETQGARDPLSEAFMARTKTKIVPIKTSPFKIIEAADNDVIPKTSMTPTPAPKQSNSQNKPSNSKTSSKQSDNSWFAPVTNWWDKNFGSSKPKHDNIYDNSKSYFPKDKTESADTSTYPDYVYDDEEVVPVKTVTPTIVIGKSMRKIGSMNKMMGGKSGRMGPEIEDKDGTKGRYFQKKAKKLSTTHKFYETDKPHGPQMRQMQQNVITKAKMLNAKKMHEINSSNYYGDEKPLPKNTFRKNNAMGNSINLGGSYAGTLSPRKQSYAIAKPRAKTPSPMNGVSHNPFFKPEGGSLKRYNPYPRSGGNATGMPPTMTGGFTAKRMTKKPVQKTPSVRAKYGC
jgi:hypothetical protein